MNIINAFLNQGFNISWGGDDPTQANDITLEYLQGNTTDGWPRLTLPEGETIDGLDIDQLKLDFTIEVNNEQEALDREEKYDEVEAYGLSRIISYVSDWDTLEDVKLIASIWNMFDIANITANQISAKDTYLYTKNKLSLAMTGPIADVRAYDPTTDPSWPT